MNSSTSRLLLAVLWVASIAAAYLIGQSGPATIPTATAQAKQSAEAATSADSPERRAGRTIEAASELGEEGQPGGTKDVASVVRRARAEMASGMGGMMNLRGMIRAIAPMVELNPAQLQEALAEVEKTVREPQQRMMFYSILLGQWAETDGPAALAYAEERLKTKSPFDFGVRASVLGSWARQDPDAAWRWYEKNRDANATDPGAQMTASAVFAGLASRDMDTALTRLSALPESERGMALNGIVGTVWDSRNRERLLQRSEGLEEKTRKQIQEMVVRNWAMNDAEAALKWLNTRPVEEQPALRTAAGSMLMMSDPQRGAQLMVEGTPEKDRARTYDTVVGQWAHRDPRAAGEWLMKQPQGPELDNARQSFASIVMHRDPAAAMDWAKSVTNDDGRTASVERVYATWRQRDATAADAALETSGLSAEKISELRKNLPVKAGQ